MSVCVISQPRFFPGLHYLHRMLVADVFVIFDTVQYNSRHEENRAKLKGTDGSQWLTVPMTKRSREQLIIDTKVSADQPWQPKAIRTLENLYGKAPHFAEHADDVLAVIEGESTTLTDLDVASWQPALAQLAPHADFVRASELSAAGAGGELLLNICQEVGATTYLSGAAGKDYLDPSIFAAADVALDFHDYVYPIYQQRFGDFVPYLSYLDMLFNVGLDREMVMSGSR